MKDMSNQSHCASCAYSCMSKVYTEADFNLLEKNRSEVSYKKGDPIIKQGNFVHQILYIKKGIVKIILEGKNEKNTILKIVNDANFVGLSVIGQAKKYPFSVIALSDCDICFIELDVVRAMMQNDLKAFNFFLNWVTKDYMALYKKIAITSTRNSHGKLASALLYLNDEKWGESILNLLSRQEISDISAISKESVNKILQQMNHDGIIEVSKDKISIKRPDLLEKLSTVG